MSPFQYRILDLMADYAPRFTAFPKMWNDQIKDSSNFGLLDSFGRFLDEMIGDELCDYANDLHGEEWIAKLGKPTEEDSKAIKLLFDLGLNDAASVLPITYFAARRNLLEDRRCWERAVEVIDAEISIRAC